jgi:hypothetical protein
MKKVFDKYKGMTIKHFGYTGILCGYNDEHFILAIISKNCPYSFKTLPKDSVIELKEYSKHRYIYENETNLIKQWNMRLDVKNSPLEDNY